MGDAPRARTAAVPAVCRGRSGPPRQRALCDRAAATRRDRVAPPGAALPDRAAEGFAALFARSYLTWDAANPLASQRTLQPFVGPGIEPAVGLALPSGGRQQVQWVEVVQQRQPSPAEHVYTLAAQTDTGGLLYLTVSVLRAPDGRLALAGYPSIVGQPASGPAQVQERLREVADPALASVVQRAVRNYLAASAGELAADLTSSARVSLPGQPFTLVSTQAMNWSPDGRSVIAVVQARDGRGVQYTLAYELDVTLVGGRWEVSAVQTEPYA